jgi:tRNA A-37 threonylcarbamoyl transferase component Bud32
MPLSVCSIPALPGSAPDDKREESVVAFVEINSRYAGLLHGEGLDSPERFLELQGVIVSGHPDRNVSRVTVGPFPHEITCFMKREHHIPWRDRLANAWAGFGFVSKSQREALTLQALEHSTVACPEWIAYGEDDAGRAFLLLRAIAEAQDLRVYLKAKRPTDRHRFVHKLGQTIAALHNAGFDHPDLYSKHILVDAEEKIHVLDWQRSRRRPIGWRQRWRDLAAMSATLSDEMMHRTERALCLRSYLRACRIDPVVMKVGLLESAFHILRRERALLQRRRIREMRQVPLTPGQQSLVWVDGEALCMTQAFQRELGGRVPDWIRFDSMPSSERILAETKHLTSGRTTWLVRRRAKLDLRKIASGLLGRTPVSPEVKQAALLFRLERHGIAAPKLLAFGERAHGAWERESFLLMELPQDVRELGHWLREMPPTVLGGTLREHRRQLVRQTGTLMRRLHDATVSLDHGKLVSRPPALGGQHGILFVREFADGTEVFCGAIEVLTIRRRRMRSHALADLVFLRRQFAGALGSRTDELRFIQSYLGIPRVTPAARDLARTVSKSDRSARSLRLSDSLLPPRTSPPPKRKAVA